MVRVFGTVMMMMMIIIIIITTSTIMIISEPQTSKADTQTQTDTLLLVSRLAKQV